MAVKIKFELKLWYKIFVYKSRFVCVYVTYIIIGFPLGGMNTGIGSGRYNRRNWNNMGFNGYGYGMGRRYEPNVLNPSAYWEC